MYWDLPIGNGLDVKHCRNGEQFNGILISTY